MLRCVKKTALSSTRFRTEEGTLEQFTVLNGADQDSNKSVNMTLNIATDVSFEDENEDYAVDSTVDDNGTANAVEAKVIYGHAEQEAIDQMMLPYLQLQNTAKFEYI
ncbi:hypothetical protein MAM1_0070c04143 [Mucor ambiguus]|uniref:Uncharacterized protein n=1 Tax=Mucor ambiguus TaxID=91626 RepID=A0A0C9LUA4_9FUNG|nr:hypothetical protein MAM1_0070c04143 [Mucor ambiguus]